MLESLSSKYTGLHLIIFFFKPGDIVGLMFFFGVTTAVYLILGLWYYCGMKMFQDAAIPIQKYFMGTIILGFLATAFKGIDLFLWNIYGMRSPVVMYIGKSVTSVNSTCLKSSYNIIIPSHNILVSHLFYQTLLL